MQKRKKNVYQLLLANSKALYLLLGVTILIVVGVIFSSDFPESRSVESDAPGSSFSDSWGFDFFLSQSIPDSVILAANKRLIALGENVSSLDKIYIYNTKATALVSQSNYNEALFQYGIALEEAYLIFCRKSLGAIYNNIGLAHLHIGNYKDALSFFLKSSGFKEQTEPGYYITLTNIGQLYLEIGDPDRAYDFLRDAMEGLTIYGNDYSLIGLHAQKGVYYMMINNTADAFEHFNEAIRIAKYERNHYQLSRIYYFMGNAFFLNGYLDFAEKYYLLSDSTSNLIKSPSRKNYARMGLTKVMLEKENIDLAMQLALNGLEEARKLKSGKMEYNFKLLLARIYEENGDIAESFVYLKSSKEKQEQLFAQTEVSQIYNQEIEFMAKQMEVREMESERQQMLLTKQKNKIAIAAITITASVIIFTLLYIGHKNKINQLQRDKINQEKVRLSYEKNAAVLKTELHERKRLGMELHDGLGTLISLCLLNLSSVLGNKNASNERKRDLLKKTHGNLKDVLKEMKCISQNLAPLGLIDKGLEYALRDLAAKIILLNKYSVKLNLSFDNKSLGVNLEHALYRTIQEMLNNTIMHAGATEITIDVFQSQTDITVMIEDNGKGFDPNIGKKGQGLNAAAVRIESLGGDFHIDSKVGRGTIIFITLPLMVEQEDRLVLNRKH